MPSSKLRGISGWSMIRAFPEITDAIKNTVNPLVMNTPARNLSKCDYTYNSPVTPSQRRFSPKSGKGAGQHGTQLFQPFRPFG